MSIGTGIAVVGMWGACAVAVAFGAEGVVFVCPMFVSGFMVIFQS